MPARGSSMYTEKTMVADNSERNPSYGLGADTAHTTRGTGAPTSPSKGLATDSNSPARGQVTTGDPASTATSLTSVTRAMHLSSFDAAACAQPHSNSKPTEPADAALSVKQTGMGNSSNGLRTVPEARGSPVKAGYGLTTEAGLPPAVGTPAQPRMSTPTTSPAKAAAAGCGLTAERVPTIVAGTASVVPSSPTVHSKTVGYGLEAEQDKERCAQTLGRAPVQGCQCGQGCQCCQNCAKALPGTACGQQPAVASVQAICQCYKNAPVQDAPPKPMGQHHDTLLSVQEEAGMLGSYRGGIIISGWLHKLVGKTPCDVNWKKYWFYLVGDRLYYSTDAQHEKPLPGSKARYIPLDRIPVRPLPHRRKYANVDTRKQQESELHDTTEPDMGISMVRKETLQHLRVKLRPDTCFGLVSGAHTVYLAADTAAEAQEWVRVLRQTWLHCFKHTLRGTDPKDAVHETSRLMAQNDVLRQRLLQQQETPANNDSEHWRKYMDAMAQNRMLEQALNGHGMYEIEVVSGKLKGCATSARVFIEMFGPYDNELSTGEVRLVHADSHVSCFQRGATDVFMVTAKDVGLPRTIKVWHDNTGRSPDWFLKCIRIRKRAGLAPPGPAPLVTGPSPHSGTTGHGNSRPQSPVPILAAGYPTGGCYPSPPAGSQVLHVGTGSPGALGMSYSRGTSKLSPMGTAARPGSPSCSPAGGTGVPRSPGSTGRPCTAGSTWRSHTFQGSPQAGHFMRASLDTSSPHGTTDGGLRRSQANGVVVMSATKGRPASPGAGRQSASSGYAGGSPGKGYYQAGSPGKSCRPGSPAAASSSRGYRPGSPGVGGYLPGSSGIMDSYPSSPLGALALALAAGGGPWGPWVVFPCNRWFSTQKDDYRISRMLFAGHQSPLIQYKVVTVTSDLRGASTDANVHLILHGTLGDGTRHLLSSGPQDFERGVTNEFIIEEEELGELMEVTVGHDNCGHAPAWHLDHLTATNCKTGQTFVFACRQWFDLQMGGGAIERVLPVVPNAGKLVPYTFTVVTSDIKGAGTDADVHVALHGALGSTPTTMLPSRPEHFERGQTDLFPGLVLPWVGELRALTIGHNDKGPGPDWHLAMVEVLDEVHKKKYWFACNKWLGSKAPDGAMLTRTLTVCTEDPRSRYANYKVSFHTSAMRGAGTDAAVLFQLFGEAGHTDVQRVVAPQEAFERGGVDSYDYRLPHMGKLQRMVVQHDNTGANPAWHLLKAVVTCDKDPAPTIFVCNKWLRVDASGRCPAVELLAGGVEPRMLNYCVEVVTSDYRGAGTDSAVWLEMHGTQGVVASQQLDGPGAFERGARDVLEMYGMDVGQLTKLVVRVVPGGTRPLWHLDHVTVYREASLLGSVEAGVWFPCHEWFDKGSTLVRELLPVPRKRDRGKCRYRVLVCTSDMKGAATDASICMKLIGAQGESSWHPLFRSDGDLFERGQEDEFMVELQDVGVMQALCLRTDGRSNKPYWHVDFVVVEPEGNLPVAFFVGRCWLGVPPKHPAEVQLPASFTDPRHDRAEYFIWVLTSDMKGAGTDAGINIELVGDGGSSGKQALTHANKDLFERGQTDEFKVVCRQLGALRLLRVFSDGKSSKPTWHLDYVVVQAPTGEKYYFMCGAWLGPQTLHVELQATMSPPCRRKYKVVVTTSNIRGAGTDAKVYVDIRGALGSTGRVFLQIATANCFECGQADEFEVMAPCDLGQLTQLVIGHDGSGQGPSWHCEQVEVTDIKSGTTWYFDCDQWFDKTQGDGLIERVLQASLQNTRKERTVYYVEIKTSQLEGCSTTAKVYVELKGAHGNSSRQYLKSSNANSFAKGQVDEFQLPMRSLGAINELIIGHDNSGLRPAWHCDCVSVTDLVSKATFWFDCKKWFAVDKDDGRVERVLRAGPDPGARRSVPYKITTHTSDVSDAGTDANVFVILYGKDGSDTGKLVLNKSGNCFERGRKDTFTITAKEVDPLQKLRVGHDNSGMGPAWHLTSVEVVNTLTGQTYLFRADRWLSTKHDDYQTEIDIDIDGAPSHVYTIEVFTSNLSGAGTDATVRCILYGETGETGSLLLDNPKNNFEVGVCDVFKIKAGEVGALRKMKVTSDGKGMGSAWHLDIITVTPSKQPDIKWWFYCGQWLDDVHGLEKLLAASLFDPRPTLPTYTVQVHTSNIPDAGTDANVFVEIFGAGGTTSGVRDLKGSGNLFEKGKTNKFDIRMMDLGKLTQLEVWHDNSGLGAAWHLDYIEVKCSINGRTVYFPCSKWFDTKQGDGLIRRRLLATDQDPSTFKSDYRVTVVTSDVSGAGTDADVHIIIFGPNGDTGSIELDNPGRNDFETGQTDIFEFTAPSIGKPISKIRIGHNNKGFGAAWHLATVAVENLRTGERADFECHKWFAKDKDDGLIERELFPMFPGGESWKLVIFTGTDSGAGTDADVFVALKGKEGSFGPYTLASQKGAFEQGSRDQFSLKTPPLGDILSMTLGHNAKGFGADWQVDRAELKNMETGVKYKFDFKCWLNKQNGLSATRAPCSVEYAVIRKCNYRVELTTGPTDESRMDKGDVLVDVRGKEVATGRQTLPCPPQGFWPARVEAYSLRELKDTGGILKLEIGHTGLESWKLHEVLVVNETTGARGLFLIDKLLLPGEFLLLDVQPSAPVDYEVEVCTTDRWHAGTSAAVFINLFGMQGSTGRVQIENPEAAGSGAGTLPSFCSVADACAPKSAALSRGGRGCFTLNGLPDVGIMQELEVGHDNTGCSPGWHLSWVRVTNKTTGCAALFPCNLWLAKNEGDKKIVRVLEAEQPTGPLTPPVNPGIPEQINPGMPIPPPQPVNDITPHLPDRDQYLLRKLGAGSMGPPGYKVTFITSNVVMAGTNAQVFFELVGENGSSGLVMVRALAGQFTRGAADEFVFPRLPYLGEVLQVRVGTSGQGMMASWHVKHVDVTHISSGDTWRCPCHDWLDKKNAWQRILPAARLSPTS